MMKSSTCRLTSIRSITAVLLALALSCGAGALLFGCSQTSSVSGSSSSQSAESETVESDITEVVPIGVRSAHLKLSVEPTLAAEVSPDVIKLDGAFSGFNVDSVERVGDTRLDLVVSSGDAKAAKDEPYAYVMFKEDAFANYDAASGTAESAASASASANAESANAESAASASGESADASAESASAEEAEAQEPEYVEMVALGVRDAEATIVPLEGSYDSDASLFYLPISLGYAEFARAPEAGDFTLSDSSLKIVGVDYDGTSLNKATLKIEAPAEAPADTFDALDAALTKDGIVVAEDATNCGKLVIGSSDMRRAEVIGSKTTALTCLVPHPSAYISDTYSIESKTQDDDGETDYDVHMQTAIDAAPGSCWLPDTGIEEVVHVDSATDDDQILGEEIIRIDKTQLFLNVYMPSKIIDAFSGAEGDEARHEAEKVIAKFARQHKLVLDPGVLSNAWGVPMPKTDVPILFGPDFYAEDEGADQEDPALVELVEKAYADEGDGNSDGADDEGGDSASSASEGSEGSSSSASSASKGGEESGSSASSASNSSESTDPEKSNGSEQDVDPSGPSAPGDGVITDVKSEIGDMPDGLADADASYGNVDYSAYDLAENDEDLKKAKEAFEGMQRILETAGAFARGLADDPSGWIEGIGGVFGFISDAMGWGDPGEYLTLQDVMDKLNKMDDEIKTLDSKMDKLGQKITDSEAREKYEAALTSLRDALNKTEIFGPTLKADVWNKGSAEKWKYDEKKGFDGMSAEQIQALEDFLDDVAAVEEEFDDGSAMSGTIKLGKLIVGDSNALDSSILKKFNDSADTMFNWEPEVYMYRQLFMARLGYAYMCGYTTAMTKLQYKAYKEKKTGGRPERYTQLFGQLADSYCAVQKVLQGEVVFDKKTKKSTITESKFVEATHARSDGLIKNLVTDTLFGLGSEELIYKGGVQKFSNNASEPTDLPTWKWNGSISRGQFEIMAERRKRVGDRYKSLWEEIVGMTGSKIGFLKSDYNSVLDQEVEWNTKTSGFSEEVHVHLKSDGKTAPNGYYGRILVTDLERHTLDDRPTIRHTYNWTGDYFDLNDDSIHTGVEIYRADQWYQVLPAWWWLDLRYNHYYTMVARQAE